MLRQRGQWIVFAVLVLFSTERAQATDATASAEDQNPHVWQPRTKSVAVFKNGLGFFVREAPIELHDGWAVAKEVPAAKFGTLAIYAADADKFVDIVGAGPGEIIEFDGRDSAADPAAKRTQLESALKLQVQLTYKHRDEERTASGKLVSLATDFAVLESGANSFAVPIDEIKKLQVLEMPLRVHVAGDREAPREARLGMAYLRDSITWIPEYSLRVLDDHTAELTLRGTLINEAEDLVHCDVNFVVGVPHFEHTDYLAPIAVGQMIRSLGAAVARPAIQSQIMNRAAIANHAPAEQFDGIAPRDAGGASPDGLAATLGNLPRFDSASGNDFTVYTKTDLTVRRGERAIVTLLVKKISYSHIYRWMPPAAMEHFFVLQNDTDTAWTTGPCLAVNAAQPLSEDLLKYTPRGGRCEFAVTASVNISHEITESETDRKFKAHSPANDVYFDLVTLEGQLKLKSFEPSPVEIVIVNSVPGKPVSASDDGQLVTDSTKLELLEREGSITWTVKLQPGESRVLKYKYERYVPSR